MRDLEFAKKRTEALRLTAQKVLTSGEKLGFSSTILGRLTKALYGFRISARVRSTSRQYRVSQNNNKRCRGYRKRGRRNIFQFAEFRKIKH